MIELFFRVIAPQDEGCVCPPQASDIAFYGRLLTAEVTRSGFVYGDKQKCYLADTADRLVTMLRLPKNTVSMRWAMGELGDLGVPRRKKKKKNTLEVMQYAC